MISAACTMLACKSTGRTCWMMVLPVCCGPKRLETSCPLSQDLAWCLRLHSIPWMWDNSGRGPYRHTQGLKVIDPAPPPVLRPVSRELRRAFPELFIVGVVLRLSKRDLFDTIFPIPPGL